MVDLEHLVRVTFPELIGKDLTDKPCWVDQVVWDIPETVLSYIANAPPNVKALTFRPQGDLFDSTIRSACKDKGITAVWAKPPKFVRYLWTDNQCLRPISRP